MGDKCKEAIDEIWQRIVKMEKDLYGAENPSGEVIICNKLMNKKEKFKNKLDQQEDEVISLGNKLETMREDFSNQFKQLNSKYIDLHNELKTDLSNKSNEIVALTEIKEKLLKENKELRDEKENLEHEIRSLNREREEIEDKYNELQNKLSDKGDKLEKVSSELEDKKRRLDEIRTKAEQQDGKISNLNGELEQIKKELEDEKGRLTTEKEKLKWELTSVKDSLHARENELKDAKEHLNDTNQKLGNYNRQFGNWEDVTRDYRNILSKLYECQSLKGIIEKYRLEINIENADTVDNVLKFIGVLGVGDGFALEIYNVMRRYKSIHSEYINAKEKSFIDELNMYYRKVMLVEFNVLDVPETEKFEDKVMQDMVDTRRMFRKILGVYVPGLRKDETGFKQKVIVHGSKD